VNWENNQSQLMIMDLLILKFYHRGNGELIDGSMSDHHNLRTDGFRILNSKNLEKQRINLNIFHSESEVKRRYLYK
jgi:hypothetical protein